eukprot:TRINITY_DN10247_c1_g1_i1.p1 TRINITY_DN10247_c1_g1~~TRINITY_DN10247_c1_g1_i1.p1  ORF type:complete len:1294 (-),score=185.64 TRINITY_DN10247_c1_g1_i1:300-4106(-)
MALLQALQQQVQQRQQSVQGEVQELPAYYLSLLEVLDNVDVQAEQQAAQAAFCILELILQKMEIAWIRKYYERGMNSLIKLTESSKENVAALRHLIGCMSRVLSCMDTTIWPSPLLRVPFQILVVQSKDQRAKVRKAAHHGLAEVLEAVNKSFILQDMSALVAQECESLLKAPVQHMSNTETSNKAKAVLAAGAVKEALHFLNGMKLIIPHLDGGNAYKASVAIVQSFQTGQQLLILTGAEVLGQLMSPPSHNLSAEQVQQLLSGLLRINPDMWETPDVKTVVQLIQVVTDGMVKLNQLNPGQASIILSLAFHTLAPQMMSTHVEIALCCGQSLQQIVKVCVRVEQLHEKGQGGKPGVIVSVIGCLNGMANTGHMQCWPILLPVVGQLIKSVGREGSEACKELVSWVGDVVKMATETQEEDQYWTSVQQQSQTVLGYALRTFGPKFVIGVLPLNIEQVAMGKAEEGSARAWLIPLMRREIREVEIGAWGELLLPTARFLGTRFNELASESPEASNLHALELQIWATLPSFASWARDVPDAFDKYNQIIGAAFVNRVDLRTPICNFLKKVCSQTQLALKVHCPELCSAVVIGEDEDLRDDEDGVSVAPQGHDEAADEVVPDWFTPEIAQSNLKRLKQHSEVWLSALLQQYWKTTTSQAQIIGSVISLYSQVSEESVCMKIFKDKFQMLLQAAAAVQEGQDHLEGFVEAPQDILVKTLETCLFLAGGLNLTAIEMLFKTVSLLIDNKIPAVQKKVYKILAYLIGRRKDFRSSGGFEQALQLLLANVNTVVSAAKRFRMRAIKHIIVEFLKDQSGCLFDPQTLQNKDQILYSMLTEIVLCVKENNTKTRNLGYDLLVEIGRLMKEGGGNGVYGMFTVVMAGLGGKTHHTMSASLMGMARLLYEFMPQLGQVLPQLVPAVCELLKNKDTELITSVLGFLKVIAMRAPLESLEPLLPDILKGILLYAEESKHRFKFHVRLIVQRLAKRCGYGAVEKYIPEKDRRLLSHIRQQNNRKTRKRMLSKEGNDMELDFDVRSSRSMGKSMKRSEWGHTKVFEVEGSEEEEGEANSRGNKQSSKSYKSGRVSQDIVAMEDDENPIDLQEMNTKGGINIPNNQKHTEEKYTKFDTDSGGKILIQEDDLSGKKRKKREIDDMDVDGEDSDEDELRNVAGIKSSKSETSRSTKMTSFSSKSNKSKVSNKSIHSGDRYKAKKGGAGGDAKGKAKLEPYAYWKLDRRMLNKRKYKRKNAKYDLDKVVNAVKVGAGKAKRRKVKF